MMRVGMWDSSSISTLFSGLNGSRNTSSASSFINNLDLGTYSSIKSGSYFKLLKSYYSENLDSKASSLVSSSVATAADDTKTLGKIQSDAGDLVKSAQDLYKSGSKDDADTTYKKVSAFVDDYNSLVSAASKSETSKITKNLESMQSLTDMNAKSLAKIGISIDSKSGKLSVDEETFKKADQTKVKALFNGNGSYAYGVATKASMMEYTAKSEAEKSNTYSANGRYNNTYSSGSNYNYFL
ncbi:flagellar filament capping protein FliD [Agathobacter sp.]